VSNERVGINDDLLLIVKLIDVAASLTGTTNQALEEFGLSESTGALLWSITPEAEPVTMRQLAKKLNFDPSNISLLSTRLEDLGLVERRPHPSDGRSRILALTPEGNRVWHRLVERVLASSPLAKLTVAERLGLRDLLDKAQ